MRIPYESSSLKKLKTYILY